MKYSHKRKIVVSNYRSKVKVMFRPLHVCKLTETYLNIAKLNFLSGGLFDLSDNSHSLTTRDITWTLTGGWTERWDTRRHSTNLCLFY